MSTLHLGQGFCTRRSRVARPWFFSSTSGRCANCKSRKYEVRHVLCIVLQYTALVAQCDAGNQLGQVEVADKSRLAVAGWKCVLQLRFRARTAWHRQSTSAPFSAGTACRMRGCTACTAAAPARPCRCRR
jgi:hypothetical protein